jgi:hypothetical protein
LHSGREEDRVPVVKTSEHHCLHFRYEVPHSNFCPSLISLELADLLGWTPVLERVPSLVTTFCQAWWIPRRLLLWKLLWELPWVSNRCECGVSVHSDDPMLIAALSHATNLELITHPEVVCLHFYDNSHSGSCFLSSTTCYLYPSSETYTFIITTLINAVFFCHQLTRLTYYVSMQYPHRWFMGICSTALCIYVVNTLDCWYYWHRTIQKHNNGINWRTIWIYAWV